VQVLAFDEVDDKARHAGERMPGGVIAVGQPGQREGGVDGVTGGADTGRPAPDGQGCRWDVGGRCRHSGTIRPDPLVAQAATPDVAARLLPLPLEVIYELGLSPAVRLAAGGTELTEE
jgi:hypothetical protein